jgi:hydroxymethylpyrimidine pyrophosphatase-like HAD family hydrolase
LGIDTANAVAFGDSGNDLAMLEAVGDGVAMANASEDVRAVATHVTAQDCDAGGEGAYLLAKLGLR